MSAILGTAVTGAGGVSYSIDNSVRLRSSASAAFDRTPTSATNRTTWTWSGWVKLGTLGTNRTLLSAANSDENNEFWFQISSGNNLAIQQTVGGTTSGQIFASTTAVFRDPSAWYHIVLSMDTGNGTSANRARFYVNGVQQTAFSSYTVNSVNTWVNNNCAHTIGKQAPPNSGYFDGYLAEVNFIDGQALTPSSFGESNASTGVWQPKAYTGTYGTNGFYLKFSSIGKTSGSNTGFGQDFSGNGNYWTTTNISSTNDSTYDGMTDSPTPKSSTVGNFAVLNPIDNISGSTFSNGNLQIVTSNSGVFGCRSTMAVSSGKWYWEMTPTSNVAGAECAIGIDSSITPITSSSTGLGFSATSYSYRNSGNKVNNSVGTAYGASYTDNDVIGVALDMDAGTLVFYKNGVSQGTAFSSLSGTFTPAMSDLGGVQGVTLVANFGQRPFAYTPPSGFNRLQTFNLPTPTIGASATTQANRYFDIALWTGNGVNNRTITGLNFQPDLVWSKARSDGYDALITDAVRGAGLSITPSSTAAQVTNNTNGYVSAFTSNGFTLTQGASSIVSVNESFQTYVGWTWDANGAGSTNTAGSITSTVSANTTSGFSIVTYTGNGSSGATVGHGLGVAPRMIIVKNRTTSGTSWAVYTAMTGNTNYLRLNSGLISTVGSTFWNNTTPTSSVFTLGTDSDVNANTNNYVAYCFSQIAGYSAFGSYTGNGSTDGPFVYLGFRPRFIMFKRTDAANSWYMYDTARTTINVMGAELAADSSGLESIFNSRDFLSNGFKLRSTNASLNASGGTYIYMAFAESPFKFSLAR